MSAPFHGRRVASEMTGYILKPIRQSELREAIARLLGAREHTGPIPLMTGYSLREERE